MTNISLAGGDDTKYHVLAGFDTVDDTLNDGGAGTRQGAGFAILQAAEKIRIAFNAALVSALSNGGSNARGDRYDTVRQ